MVRAWSWTFNLVDGRDAAKMYVLSNQKSTCRTMANIKLCSPCSLRLASPVADDMRAAMLHHRRGPIIVFGICLSATVPLFTHHFGLLNLATPEHNKNIHRNNFLRMLLLVCDAIDVPCGEMPSNRSAFFKYLHSPTALMAFDFERRPFHATRKR